MKFFSNQKEIKYKLASNMRTCFQTCPPQLHNYLFLSLPPIPIILSRPLSLPQASRGSPIQVFLVLKFNWLHYFVEPGSFDLSTEGCLCEVSLKVHSANTVVTLLWQCEGQQIDPFYCWQLTVLLS